MKHEYGEVGADTAVSGKIRTTSIITELRRIKEKLSNGQVPSGKKEKLHYRRNILLAKFGNLKIPLPE